MVLAAVLVTLGLAGAAPQSAPASQAGPPRDLTRRPPPEAAGTGVIRGRVVAADTGAPVRRAQVSLSPVAPPAPPMGTGQTPPTTTTMISANGGQVTTTVSMTAGRPKGATTDSQGAFEFRDLPAGSYRLRASPAQYSAGYLGIAFGATRPIGPVSSDPGQPIELAEGQTFDKATIALPRGGVITGRVTDENGEALARVQVYTVLPLPGSTRTMRTGGNAQTDDLGQFRLFGLAPGDYFVAAEARGNTFVPPNAPPETDDDKIGFITTYFPTGADEASGQRVRAKAGVETPGVEIRMISGRLFHITGIITDSQGRPSSRSNGILQKRSLSGGGMTYGFNTDGQGRFQMRNIAPGAYRLIVRQQQQQPPQPPNPDGSVPDPGEFATLPLTVDADLDDLLVTTSRGATITGTLVFENGPPQMPSGQGTPPIRVSAAPGDPEGNGSLVPSAAVVAPDLTFTMKGLSGELLLRGSAPQNALKSVQLAGGEDITDTPHEFKNGERVTITLTSQASMIEGTVTDAAGKPATEAMIFLFSDDKSLWRSNSIRTRRGGIDSAGHYRLPGLLPGRYYLIAVPQDRMVGLALADPASFDTLSKEATLVVVGQDEQRQVDVRISSGG